MKKTLALLMSLVLIIGSLMMFTSCSEETKTDLEYVKGKGKLIVGITEYAPMNYKEEGSDEWTGFDTELALLVGKKLGVDVEFHVIADWDFKVQDLDTKVIDCVWNGMTITEDLKKSIDISDPYVVNAQVIVTKAANAEKYATAESVKDAKIAVESGSAGEDCVEGYKNVTPVQYQSDALMEVQSGASDVCVIDITMAKAMTGEGTSYPDLVMTASLSEEFYGIGFRKGSDLKAEVNKALAELKADGSLDKLAAKYELTLA